MPNVHIGNVAEFNEQFGMATDPLQRSHDRNDRDSYAATSPFFSDDPGLVILGRSVDEERWWGLLSQRLNWPSLKPTHVHADLGQPLSEAVARHPTAQRLLGAAISRGEGVLCWGESPAFRNLVSELPQAQAPRSVDPGAQALCEDKVSAGEFFAAARAASSEQIESPKTAICSSSEEFARAVRLFGLGGQHVVVKAPFGLGGYGTELLAPSLVDGRNSELDALSFVRNRDERFQSWPLIVQEHITKLVGQPADFTCDAEVVWDGTVAVRGDATMFLDGMHYVGAVTSGPVGVLPEAGANWRSMQDFTLAVGQELATTGYRGWFDVDFMAAANGRLFALEINARRTGPMVPIRIADRIRRTEGRLASVACLDALPLPYRVSASRLYDAYVASGLERLERILPTAFLATDARNPSFGMAALGRDSEDAVQCLQRAQNTLLTELLNNV